MGVPKSIDEAAEWYERAVDAGDTDALCALGDIHFHGFGKLCDRKRALELFRRAAELGSADG